jgi:hypothetical protein
MPCDVPPHRTALLLSPCRSSGSHDMPSRLPWCQVRPALCSLSIIATMGVVMLLIEYLCNGFAGHDLIWR